MAGTATANCVGGLAERATTSGGSRRLLAQKKPRDRDLFLLAIFLASR
jgi:hypothetical protein